jgi:hypothetical protein
MTFGCGKCIIQPKTIAFGRLSWYDVAIKNDHENGSRRIEK